MLVHEITCVIVAARLSRLIDWLCVHRSWRTGYLLGTNLYIYVTRVLMKYYINSTATQKLDKAYFFLSKNLKIKKLDLVPNSYHCSRRKGNCDYWFYLSTLPSGVWRSGSPVFVSFRLFTFFTRTYTSYFTIFSAGKDLAVRHHFSYTS